MTDVRDREPLTASKEQIVEVVPPRRSLVARALAPIRARSTQELVPPGQVLDLQSAEPPVVVPKSKTGFYVVWSLIVVVLLPLLAGGIYLFVIASDLYVAETRFAVRKADPVHFDGFGSSSGSTKGDGKNDKQAAATTSSSLLGGSSLAGEDAEIVANYIHSRAAVDDVSRILDLRSIFRRPEADPLTRLGANATAEELTKCWNKMISVYVETSSGIVTVSASAFRREDALALARAILNVSEHLANSLTLKMRADQTALAESEVRRSEGNVRFALADLTAFRNSQHLIDPVETSKSTGSLLMQLMSDRIETEGRLFVTQRAQGPNAPGITATKARLDSINSHIAELQDQLAGNKETAKNMAATMSRFEELEIKKEFSEKMFEFARKGLERAQLLALAQSIYLAVFMPPSLPQDYTYPNRFTDFFLLALAAVMTWISAATITASILDHRL